ncbi:hypothetical protein [Bradyrhizobium sp. McL0615]|uniref:hypothetical protein n=1 Tax=Bradyrhizobium sp. McL0615 TaxID=3415673 RepID=UPI003CFB30DE
MTNSITGDPPILEEKLSRRDWFLLPALSLLTIAVIVGFTETLARRSFGVSTTSLDSCLVLNDAATGVRGIPNAVCLEKIPETQMVEYKFDCAGYRNDKPCGSRTPGAYRIALIGSSIAMGNRVPIEQTLATSLPEELSRRVGRQIELYNHGMAFGFPRNTALRFNDVLATRPNLVLWIVSSIDVKLAGFSHAEDLQVSTSSQPGVVSSLKNAIKDKIGGNPLAASLKMLGYFLQKQKSQGELIRSYLAIPNGSEGAWDSGPSALKAELSQEWEGRLGLFEGYVAEIGKKAKAAGVPMAVVMVPTRAQAAMISMAEWPAGYDPFKLDRELASITARHGATYIDILPQFRATPNPERYFYPVDGHPDADGHRILTQFIAKELTGGAVSELRAFAQSDGASGRVR